MANKSEDIRRLAKSGIARAEIARQLGIRYQHVYNVLKRAGLLGTTSVRTTSAIRSVVQKPRLTDDMLLRSGFKRIATWEINSSGCIALDTRLPSEQGVYAFSLDGTVQYVGVATMGLAKRLYFYGKPGISQRTSVRLNGIIKELIERQKTVEVLIATPPDLEWNGLPVHGCAGLELGLIKAFDLPWNHRSSG